MSLCSPRLAPGHSASNALAEPRPQAAWACHWRPTNPFRTSATSPPQRTGDGCRACRKFAGPPSKARRAPRRAHSRAGRRGNARRGPACLSSPAGGSGCIGRTAARKRGQPRLHLQQRNRCARANDGTKSRWSGARCCNARSSWSDPNPARTPGAPRRHIVWGAKGQRAQAAPESSERNGFLASARDASPPNALPCTGARRDGSSLPRTHREPIAPPNRC
mmetsp:Transcript_105943/g.341796  ORF Transcript_105943/g.341796 Transcript_105943/m.341796 type:complete len:220 (+) Transcript_105943:833-1492(+)